MTMKLWVVTLLDTRDEQPHRKVDVRRYAVLATSARHALVRVAADSWISCVHRAWVHEADGAVLQMTPSHDYYGVHLHRLSGLPEVDTAGFPPPALDPVTTA